MTSSGDHHRESAAPAAAMMETQPTLDDSTVRGCAAGADWAWHNAYTALAAPLRGFVISRGISSADADDIVADTFIRMAAKADQFVGGPAEFRAWAFAIARNLAVDHFRREAKSQPQDPAALAQQADAATEEIPAIGNELLTAVQRELTEDQFEIFVLHAVSELALNEVAHVTDSTPASVRKVMQRVRQRLMAAAREGRIDLEVDA